MTTAEPERRDAPANPFAAADVGALYASGRPYHHPRTLARVRDLVGDSGLAVARALDVACGTGLSTVALAEFVDAVVGLDLSTEMMRAAPALPNVDYLLGRAEQLPFAAAAFDAVTCSSGLHWFDQPRFFAELVRVVRPGGWIGLYDHYFIGMPDVPGFREWVATLFERFPLPARNAQVGDPRSETPPGFEAVATDMFDDPIAMTREQFADYQLTISSCVAAAERGTPRPEIRDWLLASTEPLFGDAHPTRVVRFVGSVNVLRRLP